MKATTLSNSDLLSSAPDNYPHYCSSMRVSDQKTLKYRARLNEDLLSNFHEEILVDILSLLPTIEAVRTSILSRRWRNLWKCLQSIQVKDIIKRQRSQFQVNGITSLEKSGSQNNLISYNVAQFISSFCSPKVFKLEIELPFVDSLMPGAIDACVNFAFHRHVEDMKLSDLASKRKGSRCFRYWYDAQQIPDKLFVIKSLVNLNLVGCRIKLPQLVTLPLLKTLGLVNCNSISSSQVQELISKCPSLLSVHIEGLQSSGVCNIRHLKLKELHVDMYYQVRCHTPDLELLELIYIKLDERNAIKGHVLEDVFSLFKLEFRTKSIPLALPIDLSWALWGTLSNVDQVNSLYISGDYIKYLGISTLAQPLMLECTCMTLEISFGSDEEILALESILAASHQIEKLIIIVKVEFKHSPSKKSLTSLSKCFLRMTQLIEVEIKYDFYSSIEARLHGYANKGSVLQKMELANLVLENSSRLKTMTVSLDKRLEDLSLSMWDMHLDGLEKFRINARSPSNAIIKLPNL